MRFEFSIHWSEWMIGFGWDWSGCHCWFRFGPAQIAIDFASIDDSIDRQLSAAENEVDRLEDVWAAITE